MYCTPSRFSHALTADDLVRPERRALSTPKPAASSTHAISAYIISLVMARSIE